MKLTFDHLPDGITLNDRSHWAVRKKATDTAHALVADKLRVPPKIAATVALHLHFYLPDKRRRDLDNLIGAVKPYIDGLVLAGLLRDDGQHCITEVKATWEYRQGQPGFEMRMEE